MLKRSLMFIHPAMLSLKNAQLVVRKKELPDETQTVAIEDIGLVMIDNPMVTMTIPLINALADHEVAVVFCNEKGMPNSMLLSLSANNTQGETLRHQLEAGEVLKKNLWKQIVEAKIRNQAALLKKLGKHGELLKPLYSNVKSGDTDNREGIAAKIYWTELFGKGFIRDRNLAGANTLLNYGYTVLRAAVARALVCSGLFPALGIFHRNRSNAYPLADDMIEPYRPFVDEVVYTLLVQGQTELTTEVKGILLKVLYCDTAFAKVTRPLSVGLSMTMASLAKCYAKQTSRLSLPVLQ